MTIKWTPVTGELHLYCSCHSGVVFDVAGNARLRVNISNDGGEGPFDWIVRDITLSPVLESGRVTDFSQARIAAEAAAARQLGN